MPCINEDFVVWDLLVGIIMAILIWLKIISISRRLVNCLLRDCVIKVKFVFLNIKYLHKKIIDNKDKRICRWNNKTKMNRK